MNTSFTIKNGIATLAMTISAPVDRMKAIVDAASHELWGRGLGDHGTEEEPIEFDDLSYQQKVELIGDYTQMIHVNNAKAYHIEVSKKAAQLAAQEYADSNLTVH